MAKGHVAFSIGMYGEADADAISERLEELIEKHKEHVTPEEILKDARQKTSPLHPLFTWDKEEAAHRHNLREAKKLVESLVVAKHGKPTSTRAFLYVHHPEYGGKKVFLSRRTVIGREELRTDHVNETMRYYKRFYNSAMRQRVLRGLKPDLDELRTLIERRLLQSVQPPAKRRKRTPVPA